MRINTIGLVDFTVFENVRMKFSPGLNVLIGENGTGKSHLMKLLYSMLKVLEPKGGRPRQTSPADQLREKLASVFMPDKGEIGRLVRRGAGRRQSTATLDLNNHRIEASLTSSGELEFAAAPLRKLERSIFIPSREALAMFDGFVAAYENRELSFDETYYDLCVALSAKPLKARPADKIASLVAPLREVVGGRVVLEGGRFYVKAGDGPLEAHLLAEGYRKIASLVHLISNGSLVQNGFLFWDEPEANLNPKLVRRVAEALRVLVQGGIQVFVATHDYLLSHELSLPNEYDVRGKVAARFFALKRGGNGAVEVEEGDVISDLQHNPILDEFAEHYDREQDLFGQAARRGSTDQP